MTKTKTFNGYLILNWRTGEMKMNKRKPTGKSASEFSVRVSLDVELPDRPDVEVKGKIVIPPMKVGEMILEHL